MNFAPSISSRPARRSAGLTLVEILVAITLLMVIIVGLTAMFNQTQRAFRSGLTNVDVLEGGRAALEMIARDVEQMRAGGFSNVTNFLSDLQTGPPPLRPINLPMPGGSTPPFNKPTEFTNMIDKVYFMTGLDEMEGVGFRVLNPNNPNADDQVLVGSLYRFHVNTNNAVDVPHLITAFEAFPQNQLDQTNLHRIIDGVVHFKVRAYDTNGVLYGALGAAPASRIATNNIYGVPRLSMISDQLPGYVVVEIGIIEPQVVQQARPLLDFNSLGASRFLSTNANKIHFFTQQIPIRSARQ